MSKKVKGQKVDLAALAESSAATSLPTAPNLDRDPNESRNRYHSDNNRSKPQQNEQRSERAGGWGRESMSSNRDRDYGGSRDNVSREVGGGGSGWQRRAGGGEDVFRRPTESSTAERPKLNIAPRTVEDSRPVAVAPTESAAQSTAAKDKWDNVFSKSKPTLQSKPAMAESSSSFSNTRDSRSYGRGDGVSGKDDSEDARFAGKFTTVKSSNSNRAQPVAVKLLATPEVSKPSNEAKVQKAQAKEQAQQKVRESKAAAQARLAAEQASVRQAESATAALADELLKEGRRGSELAAQLSSLQAGDRPSAGALCGAVLRALGEADKESWAWCAPDQFGAALQTVTAGDVAGQVRVLYAVQSHCHALHFPKTLAARNKPLLESIFTALYQHEILEHDSFVQWADDEAESEGRLTALVQTTSLLLLLRQQDLRDEDEEDEDLDIDAPLQTIK